MGVGAAVGQPCQPLRRYPAVQCQPIPCRRPTMDGTKTVPNLGPTASMPVILASQYYIVTCSFLDSKDACKLDGFYGQGMVGGPPRCCRPSAPTQRPPDSSHYGVVPAADPKFMWLFCATGQYNGVTNLDHCIIPPYPGHQIEQRWRVTLPVLALPTSNPKPNPPKVRHGVLTDCSVAIAATAPTRT